MKLREAIQILDLETSRDALWGYEECDKRLEAVNEACRIACIVMRKVEEMCEGVKNESKRK